MGRGRFTGPCKPLSRVRGRNYDEDADDRRRSRGYAPARRITRCRQVRPVSEEHCWLRADRNPLESRPHPQASIGPIRSLIALLFCR